jgi:hypothetical protein
LVYFINTIRVLIDAFPEFPRHFQFEGRKEGLGIAYYEEWEQYFSGPKDGSFLGLPPDAHFDMPVTESFLSDKKHPLDSRGAFREWLITAVNIGDRVDLSGTKRGLIYNFFYNHLKDDILNRLIKMSIIPGGLSEPINDFDLFGTELLTSSEQLIDTLNEKAYAGLGHWNLIAAPQYFKGEYLGQDYYHSTWLMPSGRFFSSEAEIAWYNSKPVSTYLVKASTAESPKLFAHNDDMRLSELKWWRSRFDDDYRGRLPIIFRSTWPTFFYFKRMLFKWIYHLTFNIMLIPSFFLIINADSVWSKFGQTLYSSIDFFLEFGYNVPGVKSLDYQYFLYSYDLYLSKKPIFSAYPGDDLNNFLVEAWTLFQRFFYHSDTGVNVLFLNSSLADKTFSGFTFYDYVFFNIPFLTCMIIICFIIFPFFQTLTILTHHLNFESIQISWLILTEPTTLALQSMIILWGILLFLFLFGYG